MIKFSSWRKVLGAQTNRPPFACLWLCHIIESKVNRTGVGSSMLELKSVRIQKPTEVNVIIGQSHFIKTVEDIHEALVQAVPGIKFGLAFCEASGPCLIRRSGTDRELENLAVDAAKAIGAGHVFVVMLGNAFPVNVLNQIKAVPEVCTIYCATANPLQVIVAGDGEGRGIVGVIDGASPKGVEGEDEQQQRKALLRRLGYKL